jgi:PrtD family type I secretion system ABC transporter
MTDDVKPARALARCRAALGWAAAFSLPINLLALTTSLYMMQVYDRVLASGSMATLAYLSLVALAAIALSGALDHVRARLLGTAADWLDRRIGPALLGRAVDGALAGRPGQAELLQDLGKLCGVLGSGIVFLFDIPWVPVYLGLIYLLHPLLGRVAAASALLLLGLALLNDRIAWPALKEATDASLLARGIVAAAVRNTETVEAMHLLPGLERRWRRDHGMALDRQMAAARSASILLASRAMRQAMQVAILGTGAWLVVSHGMGAGAMLAASLVVGRAVAPLEQAVGGWRQLATGWEAWRRLTAAFDHAPRRDGDALPLPAPAGRLQVQGIVYRLPGQDRPVLNGVSFEAVPGEAVAVVGPSAAGKSMLARLAVGLHPPLIGTVRLDGSDLFQWRRDDIGRHIGYLAQDVGLFAGTVAENIARMDSPDPQVVVAAARIADCHTMIQRLPKGYDTEIGEGGVFLSGGQRQRIGLARALYGDPKLVVLDEPNATLDADGEQALGRAIAALKARRAIVLVICHRPGTLAQADRVVALREGRVEAFGPRAEVLEALKRRTLHSVTTPARRPALTSAQTCAPARAIAE